MSFGSKTSDIVMHPDAIAATIHGANLRIYSHWICACKALLADKGADVALTDGTGYIYLIEGSLMAVPLPPHGLRPSKKQAVPLSTDAWDFSNQCWQGLSQEMSDSLLQKPQFKLAKLGA